jgi:hypothetical protein
VVNLGKTRINIAEGSYPKCIKPKDRELIMATKTYILNPLIIVYDSVRLHETSK